MYERAPDHSFGPWPQPAPGFYEDAAPAVLQVPKDVQKDWNRHIGRRYVRQVLLDTLPSWLWARRHPGLVPVSDERFCAILCDGIFSKFLVPEELFDAPDRTRFARHLSGEIGSGLADGERWYKGDFSPMRLVPSDGDSATSASVVLYKRAADGAYRVTAIALDDAVFDPSDSPAWTMAKYFALQGAGVLTTLLMHPQVHFPSSCVDAITRTRLPDGSVLKKLLLPHFRLALGVNDAVLYGNDTVLRPGKLYAPYPGTLEEHAEVIATLWRGFEHPDGTPNRAYPRYRLSLDPPVIHSPYGEFLGRYHAVLLELGKKVASHVVTERPQDVAAWADHCAHWLPGFPDSRAIFEGENLARVFASIVLDVAVAHSADHYLYSKVDLREVPFRLHAKVPVPGATVVPPLESLTTVRDNFNYRMCMRMFFQPYVVSRLAEVDYGFEEPALRKANDEFRYALQALQATLAGDGIPGYVPLDEIAASVQF
jgi:hypothetical protein